MISRKSRTNDFEKRPYETVLPQPLVQKSFHNLKNSFSPTFPCNPNGEKNRENSGKFEANVS
jgi:hypothetical protein